MPTPQANLYITIAGESYGTRLHVQRAAYTKATTVVKDTPTNIAVWDPLNHSETQDMLKHHPFAYWQRLEARLVPGPGMFGRAVTLHYCWYHTGLKAPVTISEMRQCRGYRVRTFGGAADPTSGDLRVTIDFCAAYSDILKSSGGLMVGGKTKFLFFATAANFGDHQVTGDLFEWEFEGEFEVFGREQ